MEINYIYEGISIAETRNVAAPRKHELVKIEGVTYTVKEVLWCVVDFDTHFDTYVDVVLGLL